MSGHISMRKYEHSYADVTANQEKEIKRLQITTKKKKKYESKLWNFSP